MSGTTLEAGYQVDGGAGDDSSDQATQAQVAAAQAVDETAQAITTHQGTVTAPFAFPYNNATISFLLGQNFIADAGLYAALNACATSAASITWNN
jgi:hypothetical protein